MKKKSLLIVRVNPIVYPVEKAEQMRKELIKQIKDGVVVIDKACAIECYDYNAKQVEVRVIHQDDKLIVESK